MNFGERKLHLNSLLPAFDVLFNNNLLYLLLYVINDINNVYDYKCPLSHYIVKMKHNDRPPYTSYIYTYTFFQKLLRPLF